MPLPTTYFVFTYWEQRHRAVVLATVDKFGPNVAFTDVGAFNVQDSEWVTTELDGLLASDLCLAPDGKLRFLGTRGEIWTKITGQDAFDKEQLPDAGLAGRHLGGTNEIRNIAGRLYVCGYAGQVYTQIDDQWVHMDDGLVEPKARASSLNLTSLDGTGPDNLYTVGSRGSIFHWDGAWSRIPVLTNVYLHRVRCFANNWVVAVGDDATIIETTDGKRWKADQVPGCEGDLRDVAVYRDKLYVTTGGNRIFWRKGNTWSSGPSSTAVPVHEKNNFHRFAVGDGRLWVIGTKRLFSFDGKKWQIHIDPDNG